jgi:hypothetical protein
MYFNVQQASQLNTVFSSIAQNLANLRIARQAGYSPTSRKAGVLAAPASSFRACSAAEARLTIR